MIWDPVRVARRPHPLSIQDAQHATPDPKYATSLRYLSSVLGGLNVGPETGQVDQSAYKCGLAIGKACVAIEECYRAPSRRSSLIPPILVTLAKRAVRHARLATSFEHDKETHTTTQLSFQRTLQMLRREVIRAIRHEQLEFRYPKGSTFRPTAKSLKGKEWELASFINAACFAVTRALGCFDAPLLKPNAKARASDEMVMDFWDCDGLGIWWDAGVGWRVEGMGEGVLGDLSIEGSVQGGANMEERGWEDVSGEEGWANDVSESENEVDQASLYETRLKSEEGSLQEKEHKERIGRDTQTVLFADEEKALEGWKEGHRAVGNQEPVVSQWCVRGSREMMGDEMMDEDA